MMVAIVWSATLTACASDPTPAERAVVADRLAAAARWTSVEVDTSRFRLRAYVPPTLSGGGPLRIYIEGDGRAWVTRSSPSTDPTPLEPVGLELALADPSGAAVYIARPCQYVMRERGQCPARYWTEARFASEVVASMSEAIDHLKVRAGATSVVLVGYSGGGAMAALIAARRTDVVAMVTVAGNLDVAGWTAWHRISPLKTSLDPSDFIRELSPIPQWHFTGAEDAVVPSSLVRSFVDRFPDRSNAQIVEVRGFDHRCCWADAWPRLIVETGL